MFQDEARLRTASATAVIVGHRVHCDPPSRRCPRTSLSTRTPPLVMDGGVGSLVLPAVNGGCMGVSGNEVAARHPLENSILVFDGAGWHHGSMKLAPNLKLHSLPPYSTELNPVEQLWAHLRDEHFHNRAFDGLDAPEDHLGNALRELERDPSTAQSITLWPWIIDAVSCDNFNSSLNASHGNSENAASIQFPSAAMRNSAAKRWSRRCLPRA